MRAVFYPSKAIGKVCAPPSKSEAHRFLIAASLSNDKSIIHGISESVDMRATLDCIRACNKTVHFCDGVVEIGHDKNRIVDKTENDGIPVFHCYESGSTLRFMIPIALACFGGGKFKCQGRLVERGADVYSHALEKDGVCIDVEKDTIVATGSLQGGEYTLRGDVSSQYISGLMFALPLVDCDSEIEVVEPFESKKYVDMTVDVLSKFGVKIEKTDANHFFIKGGQRYGGGEFFVEGDWSNAAFLLALNEIGGQVDVCGLDENSLQGDKVCKQIFQNVGDENALIDIADCPDLAPIAFVVAALKGGAHFVNTRRLRIKESDRANVMVQELAKCGVAVCVQENDVYVRKCDIKTPCCDICGHNDHRIVMAMSVLASCIGGCVDGIQAVEKSYPNFFEVLSDLGVKYELDKG